MHCTLYVESCADNWSGDDDDDGYSCDYTVIQKSLLMNMAVAMMMTTMGLMVIRLLMIMMIANLLSFSISDLDSSLFLYAINTAEWSGKQEDTQR